MDVEPLLLAHLEDQTGVPWFHSVPAARPEEFGTLSRTGGGADGVFDEPLYTMKVWAGGWKRARALSKAAAAAIQEAPYRMARVMSAQVVSIYDDPDPDSGAPRRRVTAQVAAND